ncbi:MAG: MaoC family dehydratase N-terminal domain-containing protein [Alphaproteobacteria bacterium]|nr:MaoC family dehydratase N-terminal domain-containing protein [Alphaproteobacteria bacterium]
MQEAAKDWIGRTRSMTDVITPRLLAEFRVMLGDRCGPGEIPAGFMWCLAPDIHDAQELGRDGHPRLGLFLPDLSLPRRMWAGGEVRHSAPFALHDTVTRTSTITDVTFKQGRSGDLGFVAVEHVYDGVRGPCVSERHDIVYRSDPDPDRPAATPPAGDAWAALHAWRVTPDTVMLFRYSAMTFNGHRVHYDLPYAQDIEGYPGLVVHGPMQATWLQNLAASIFGAHPGVFRYRGLSPLIVGQPVTIEAIDSEAGLDLRVRRDADGVVTMQASAERG